MGKKVTTEDFIKKAILVHGNKYDYSKVVYVSAKSKVCIICPEHGEFWQTPTNHLCGSGCYKCGRSKTIASKTDDTEKFIIKARKVHGDKYDYSKVNYKGTDEKVCIICPEHGEFWQVANYHINGNGCQKCGYRKSRNVHTSHGEISIINILTKWNIEFKTQVPILSNVNNSGLTFIDFYLPQYNCFIEYNGEQHYNSRAYGEDHLKKQQARDKEVRQYCKDNNINLIEIRYDEDIWETLTEKLCK